MKRFIDISLALSGLVLLCPVFLALVIAIRVETRGPSLFRQDRVGRNGCLFRCYKLRTMLVDVPDVPTHRALPSFVTPLGRRLRRAKLDELPQLFNVVKGDMSLVGPRPCLPSQSELVEERRRLGVLALRPGITGLAQARGIDMTDPARLAAVDAEYLRERSFKLDMAILFRTFRLVGAERL